LQQQLVPGGDFQFPSLPHIAQGGALTQMEKSFGYNNAT
jgi:hypothetical protein